LPSANTLALVVLGAVLVAMLLSSLRASSRERS
jgi:hypothetical protein